MLKTLLKKLQNTRIPNSYYVVIALAVFSIAAVSYGISISGNRKQIAEDESPETTRADSLLSKKVNNLTLGMHRKEVIRSLGLPDWVALWGDRGMLAPPTREIALELRWKNPECREILVMFDENENVIGWDDGAHFCKDQLPLKGREPFECSQPDRAQYCR